MSSIKKSWFEKAVGNIAAVTGVNPQRLTEIIAEADVTPVDVTFSQMADQVINDLASELSVPAEVIAGGVKTEATNGFYEAVIRAACAEQGTPADVTEQLVEAVTAAPMGEPTTAEVQVEVVKPVVTTPAAKNTAHAAVKKAAAKKGKPIKALSDMDELKAKLAA